MYYIVARRITSKLCVAQVVQKGFNMNNEKEKNKPTSFRITAETNDQIKELCKKLGCTQDETFQHLISAFEMQNAITHIPERAMEIDNFRCKINELVLAYNYSLNLCADSEARAKAKVDLLLQSKDQTIMELQEKLKSAEAESQNNFKLLNTALAQQKQLENELDLAKHQIEIQQEYLAAFRLLAQENESLKNQSTTN